MKEVARLHEQSMHYQLAHENRPQRLHIGLVTVVTSDILPYAAYAIAANLFYAIHNQYIFHIVDLSNNNNDDNDNDQNRREKVEEVDHWDRYDVRWNKVKALSHAFSNWAADCDYLLWVDADLIMLDMNFKMEELIRLYPEEHLIASAEHSGSSTLINSGSLLVKNHPILLAFLSRWWGESEWRRLYSDQEAFDLLYHQEEIASEDESAEAKAKLQVRVLAPIVLNSDPPVMTRFGANQRVLHLMGEEEDFRSHIFRTAFMNLLNHTVSFYSGRNQGFGDTTSLSSDEAFMMKYDRYDREHDTVILWDSQLKIRQETLLRYSLEDYFALSQKALFEFKRNVQSLRQAQELSACRLLSNTVHHYVFGLEYLLSHPDKLKKKNLVSLLERQLFDGVHLSREKMLSSMFSTVQTMRKKVYNLLKENLLLIRRQYKDHFRPSRHGIHKFESEAVLRDYPEIAKTAAIAGQHLLISAIDHSSSTGMFDILHFQASEDNIESDAKNKKRQVDYDEQELVARELLMLCNEMLHRSHPQQHIAIQQMISYIYQQQGLIALERKDLLRAFHFFDLNVNLTYSVTHHVGEHILLQPLLLLANTLALLEKFSTADKIFNKALLLGEKYQAAHPLTYPQVLVNIAAAFLQQKRFEEAYLKLDRALAMLTSQKEEMDFTLPETGYYDKEKQLLIRLSKDYHTRAVKELQALYQSNPNYFLYKDL
eukprot:scaffold1435_cov162-Ochromonas_danica.AAC.24